MNSSSQVTTSFDWPAKPGHNGLNNVIRYCAIARDRPQHLLCHRLTSSMACKWNSVFLTTKILAFEERPWNGIFGFGLARNGTRALSLAPFFAVLTRVPHSFESEIARKRLLRRIQRFALFVFRKHRS